MSKLGNLRIPTKHDLKADLLALRKKVCCHAVIGNATIAIGAEATNVRALTIQLLDIDGAAIDEIAQVGIIMFADAAGAALATTGGSTGIEIGTDGLISSTLTAKKEFLVVSEPDGDIDLDWTDTGTEEVFLGVRLPNGRIVMSASIQNT